WEGWWYEEQEHLRTTGLAGKLLEIVLALRLQSRNFCRRYEHFCLLALLDFLSHHSWDVYADSIHSSKFTSVRFLDMVKILLAFIPTGWGMILICQVLRPFLPTALWRLVVSVARVYEIVFGVIVMAPVAFLSWMPGFQSMQTRILFNEAFSRGLQVFQIITGKRLKLKL
ncbi:hypothetical protein Tsubulata_035627, partial [Turnera subulata]